ncbi:MAG: hypothetical protein AB8B60_01210 [Sulfitobacter sp.]
MKRTLIVTSMMATLAFGSIAQAGSLSDPVVEPKLIIEDASSSSSGSLLVVALAYLILVPVLSD